MEVGGDMKGKYLNVEVNAEAQGSLLDANVTVFADSGTGWEEIAMAYDHPNGESLDLRSRPGTQRGLLGLVIQVSYDEKASVEAANYRHMSVGACPTSPRTSNERLGRTEVHSVPGEFPLIRRPILQAAGCRLGNH